MTVPRPYTAQLPSDGVATHAIRDPYASSDAPETLGRALDAELPPGPGDPDALALWLAQQLMGRLGGRLELGADGERGVTLRARLGMGHSPTDGEKPFDLQTSLGEGEV